MRKIGIALAISLIVTNMVGCSLLPKEEEVRKEEEIQKKSQYEVATVVRTNLDVYANISCNYQAEEEIGLGFEAEGLKYSKAYVSVGDEVKKGQVLAELDLGTYDSDKKQYQKNLEKLQMQESYIEDMIYYEQLKGQVSGQAYSEAKETLTDLQSQLQGVRQQEAVVNIQITEADREIKKRQIVAPYKGVITKMDEKVKGKNNSEEDVSKPGVDVIKMTDKDFCYVAQTNLYKNFSVGDEVDMTLGGKSVKMKIQRIEAIEEEETVATSEDVVKVDEKKMYLEFAGDVTWVESFTTGRINKLLESKKNILVVPNNAIVSLDGKDYVYVVGKNEIREAREVELGISDGNNTEILSGVDEGAQVIVQ